MPEISIIVPVYNVEAYLPQCLDSLRMQTFDDIEILCVIDGSTDRSEAIARLFAKADGRIRVIIKENGGLSSARNAGADAARGDILMFVDSDDLLEKNACERLYETFAEHDCEVVTFGGRAIPDYLSNPWIDGILTTRDVFYGSFDLDILFKENSHPFVWRTAVKRDFWLSSLVRFDEGVPFGEDQVYHFAIYPRAKGVCFIADKLYLYRVARTDSLMHSRQADLYKKFCDHINIMRRICADWKEAGFLDQYSAELLTWSVEFLLYDATGRYREGHEDIKDLLGGFLREWFTWADVDASTLGPEAKAVTKAFIAGGDTKAVWEAYASCVGYGRRPTCWSRFKQKLRLVLPMSALGVERRLGHTSRVIEWETRDNAACARSLAILRAELNARNLVD